MTITDKLKGYFEGRKEARKIKRFLRKNTWGNLEPGDIVECSSGRFIFCGVNKRGGFLNPLMPEPVFIPANTGGPTPTCYLRPVNEFKYLEEVEELLYREKSIPLKFIDANLSQLEKVESMNETEKHTLIEWLSHEPLLTASPPKTDTLYKRFKSLFIKYY